MFSFPETKRIRREDLFSPPPSPPPPLSPTALLTLEFTTTTATSRAPTPPQTRASTPSEFDFRLFSARPSRIRLRSPTPPEDAWSLAVAAQRRPQGYYVATETDMAARRARAAEVAVSGGEVMSGGCLVVGVRVPEVGGEEEGRRKRRRRPNKKRRIYMRVRRAVESARQEARRKSIAGLEKYVGLTAGQRDEVARQERARKNREKKVRERAKKKAKKEKEKEKETMQV